MYVYVNTVRTARPFWGGMDFNPKQFVPKAGLRFEKGYCIISHDVARQHISLSVFLK